MKRNLTAPLDLFALVIVELGHQIGIRDLEAGHNGQQPAVAPALRLEALQVLLQVRHGHGVHALAEGLLLLAHFVLLLRSELLAIRAVRGLLPAACCAAARRAVARRAAGPGAARHEACPSAFAASLASLPFIGSDLDKRDKIRILT